MNKNGFLFKLIGIIVIAIIVAACIPKKNETGASADNLENAYNPIILAHMAFNLIMQLEGRDDKDPAIVIELAAIEERIKAFSEANQMIYYSELERLYIGDVAEINENINVDVPHNATLWINGSVSTLDDGVANSVYVVGSDIYVAGKAVVGWRDIDT